MRAARTADAAVEEAAVPVETGPVGEDASIGNDKSVAVLPFANRSANEADVYFVDGIHDDILTQLSKVHALRVTSRTSVMEYRDTEVNLRRMFDTVVDATAMVAESAYSATGTPGGICTVDRSASKP